MALALLIALATPAWQPPPSLTTRHRVVPPAVVAAPDSKLTVQVPLNAPVRAFIEFFTDGRGRRIYARWLAKMGAWSEVMVPILTEAGLPPELLYVCMIESGFNPDAVSRAAAVGPWQFVRSTGQAYGLRHDDWVDERRDPVKATRAAAKHLSDLYERFGSWALVMAAYNAGVGSVARGVEAGNTNDYWRLAATGMLPKGPVKYVPKAMAAMLIGQNPAHYGFGDVVPEKPVAFTLVEVPGKLDLQRIARKADVSAEALTRLNPELRRAFTPPDDAFYALRVPTDAAARVEAAMDALVKRKKPALSEHRLRFGERLYDVAIRYGASRRELRRLNKLELGVRPAAGTVLIVPKARETVPSDALLVLPKSSVEFAVEGHERLLFPVRMRLELGEVAAFFGVERDRLALWNDLDPQALLQRGQVLRVFVPKGFDRSTVVWVPPRRVVEVELGSEAHSNALEFAAAQRSGAIDVVLHEVKRGESLWKIARRYEVPVEALRAENGLARGASIARGTKLRVPRVKTAKPRGAAARRKPKPSARGKRRYTVKRGDSLRKIADRFGVEVKDIKRRNGLKTARIYAGQELVLP